MRRAVSILLFCLLAMPVPAHANEMDITLNRLTVGDSLVPNHEAFGALMSQLGAALASPSLTPARTLGTRHFYIGVENALTSIDAGGVAGGVPYWRLGTVGDERTTRTEGNEFVNDFANTTRLSFRKGLPFGVQIGGSVGSAYDSRMVVWGGEVQVALLEGFRRRLPGFFPDIALRGAVTTVTGNSQFSLTLPVAEVIASKGIRVGGDAVLSPMVSAQMLWIVAESDPVRLVSPSNAASLDTFESMRDRRTRMSAGAQLTFRMLTLAAAMRFDLTSPGAASGNLAPAGVGRQWSLDLGAGVTY